jgi:hypothetical protein
MTTRTASCRCRQLKVTVTGEPVRIFVCHCLDYKKRSGSAFDDPYLASPRFSVWEERKHDWIEIIGQAEHSG